MLNPRTVCIALLATFAAIFASTWARRLRGHWREAAPSPFHLAVGFVTNFFDTLGVGSFAPTTALFRWRGDVADEKLPGTLNVGHCLPTVAQALIFIKAVDVDPFTLGALIVAAIAGGWLGAGFVSRLSRRKVQFFMGSALLLSAAFLLTGLLDLTPAGGDALSLSAGRLLIGVAANFVIGALMTIGVGAYAPMLTSVSLLGMNPRAAFPIMMGSCAFLTSVANLRFIKSGAYDDRAALGLTIGGIPAVALAVLIVFELPLGALRWAVLAVTLIAAMSLLLAARRSPSGKRHAERSEEAGSSIETLDPSLSLP